MHNTQIDAVKKCLSLKTSDPAAKTGIFVAGYPELL